MPWHLSTGFGWTTFGSISAFSGFPLHGRTLHFYSRRLLPCLDNGISERPGILSWWSQIAATIPRYFSICTNSTVVVYLTSVNLPRLTLCGVSIEHHLLEQFCSKWFIAIRFVENWRSGSNSWHFRVHKTYGEVVLREFVATDPDPSTCYWPRIFFHLPLRLPSLKPSLESQPVTLGEGPFQGTQWPECRSWGLVVVTY